MGVMDEQDDQIAYLRDHGRPHRVEDDSYTKLVRTI